MWVLMNNSYFSIVKNKNKKNSLVVRARIKGDIERVFPKANVIEGIGTDYQYRTFLPKWVVSKAIKKSIENIDYDNFKDSVPLTDNTRHDVYFDVWLTLLTLQRSTNSFPFAWNSLDDNNKNTALKNFTAETHPIGYQLTQAIMSNDEFVENNNGQGV